MKNIKTAIVIATIIVGSFIFNGCSKEEIVTPKEKKTTIGLKMLKSVDFKTTDEYRIYLLAQTGIDCNKIADEPYYIESMNQFENIIQEYIELEQAGKLTVENIPNLTGLFDRTILRRTEFLSKIEAHYPIFATLDTDVQHEITGLCEEIYRDKKTNLKVN